jgi:hypothetical protein
MRERNYLFHKCNSDEATHPFVLLLPPKLGDKFSFLHDKTLEKLFHIDAFPVTEEMRLEIICLSVLKS